jgi:hypothetical protein
LSLSQSRPFFVKSPSRLAMLPAGGDVSRC